MVLLRLIDIINQDWRGEDIFGLFYEKTWRDKAVSGKLTDETVFVVGMGRRKLYGVLSVAWRR